MISQLIGYLLYGNMLLMFVTYLFLYRIRKLIGFQLGMNMSMIAGGFLAIVTGVILIYQYPFHFAIVTIVTTVIGFTVGALFGALFDYQTMLTGYATGLMMGIMSPMVGAAAKNSMLFLYFIEIIFILSIIMMLSSSRTS
ncbi:hypothetical protein [Salirhabdus sp. Marseille-P4669]|uniref:hypothetical protein n=1 Tax=Salirhabdus sp. Marseille-P4669 TaxID=2042310 RepID=UPI000C7DC6A1|nr:hypothetical protein [Salirhabdus sp. Marseille-P4669]